MHRSAANLLTVLALAAALGFGIRSGWIPAPAKLAQLVQARLVLDRIDGPSSETMKLLLDGSGGVWITTKYDVTRYGGEQPSGVELLLSPKVYRNLFQRPIQAFSWASFGDELGELWVGSWYGEVLRYKAPDGWATVIDRDSGPKGKIVGLVERDGELWIATSNRLWRKSLTTGPLDRVDSGFRSSLVGLIVDVEGRMLLGSVEGVREYANGTWREVWKGLATDRSLTSLGALESGGIWLGFDGQSGRGGLLELDREDREIRHSLNGEWVTDLVELADGRRLVATWQHGLFIESGGRLRKLGFTEGLPDDSLGTMVLDRDERLWLGLYGEGVVVADLGKVEELALDADASRIADQQELEGQVFDNACEAAQSLLYGAQSSGQIYRESPRVTEAETQTQETERTQQGEPAGTPPELVFLERRLACPEGWIGYHRGEPGAWVATRFDRPERLLGESRTGPSPAALALPPRLGPFQVTALFLDARGSVWLGTRDRGVWLLTADGPLDVSDPDLLQNPVSSIAEDEAGSIWVGTSPPANRGGKSKAGLHMLRVEGDPMEGALVAEDASPASDATPWLHFRPGSSRFGAGGNRQRGLASDTVNDLLLLRDGRLAVGTNGGLTLIRGKTMETFGSRAAGLRHHFIDAMTEDSDQRMWITHAFWGPGYTRKGKVLFKNQSSRHGLFEDALFKAAFDAEGRTWLLGASGRVGIYPLGALN